MLIARISMLTVLAVTVAGPARAEDYGEYFRDNNQLAAHTSIASLSKQIADMEARLASFETGGGDDCCSQNWDSWTKPDCGITAMAEVVWLRLQDTEENGVSDNYFQHGSRFTFGKVDNCGREWRLRLFELGLSEDQGTQDDFVNHFTFDLEYAGRFELGNNWAGEISLGARYADYHQSGDNHYEDTIGPVIGLHLKSDVLPCNNTNLFANLRYSHQFGSETDDNSLGSFSITELQAGFEWARDCRPGTLFARAFVEAQKWEGVEEGDTEDEGLIGYGLAIGVNR
ncbi:MAG: hypothetical protein VX988_00325 [Planctomycetota bacterium]|nr:hypothetical protein [Planctomycetota bacterium]